MYRYIIVLFLGNPAEGSDVDLDTWKHIVVKTRFKLNGTSTKQLISYLKKAAEETKPADVTLGRIEYFPTENKLTEYINIKTELPIRDIHDAITDVIDDHVETKSTSTEGSKFIPHLLVEEGVEDMKADRLEYNGRKETFYNFYLLKERSRSKNLWKVLKKFSLSD